MDFSPYNEISNQLKVTKSNSIHIMTKFQFTLGLAAMIAVGSLFMDDAASKQNRLEMRMNRGQLVETIMVLNHLSTPIPGE